MSDSSLRYHVFDDCLWIRCCGRGCFINSPVLQNIAEKYLEEGGGDIVVDLELCPGVDSTFMGTLAGLARECMAVGGSISIASPTARTRAAMESLGLDMLLAIDPEPAVWKNNIAERRRCLAEDGQRQDNCSAKDMSELERTRHVLEAHSTLRSMNKHNDEAFGYVCESLQEDLQRQSEKQEKKQD